MNVPKLRFKEFSNDWKDEKLEDVVDFLDDRRKPIKDSDRNNIKGIYPYYGASGIIDYINDYIFDEELLLLGEDGANILSRSTQLVFKATGKYWVNNHAHVLRPKENYNIDFLESCLENINYEPYNTGTAQPKLNQEVCRKINIKTPSLKEQVKIGETLSLLDKKIELQTKKIEVLKLFKKGLLNEFLKHNPCSKISLKYILKERKNYTIKDGILPHVTLSKNGIEEKTERYNRDFLVKSKDKNYKITKIYDLCYNPANLKFGVICLNTYGSAIFSPIYVTFEINHKFNPLYIGYYVIQQNFINSARKYEQGTVYERMAVAPEDFLKMNIWVPNKHIQDKFSTILISMDTKLKKENEKLKNLEALKKGFMQSMFV